MREIKFRAWDKEHKEMSRNFDLKQLSIPGVTSLELLQNYENLEIMQFTGLKDKNGKEIFEGDILIYEEDTNPAKRVVEFKDGKFTWIDHNICKVIIGNKFENPELLK